jgi:hypothetical protein
MAAIPKPGIGPYGPALMFITCTAGFFCGGLLDHWLTGSGRAFGAFGAAFGLSVGGLVGASVVEFLLPLGLAALLLEGAGTPGTAPPPGAERLDLAGRVVQAVTVLLALGAGVAIFSWGLDPLARAAAVPPLLAAGVLGIVVVLLAGTAFGIGAALARHLDLTTP